MYPLPAVEGESLTLRCLVWGTNKISHTVFYKNDAVILRSDKPTYNFKHVTESENGTYKCNATFTYMERTNGPPYQVISDNQDVFVQGMHTQLTLFDCLWLLESWMKFPSFVWYCMLHTSCLLICLFSAPPIRAVLSANIGMTCSCPLGPSGASYRWYYKSDDGQPWARIDSIRGFMMPKDSGSYACRAVWDNRRSFLSRSYVCKLLLLFLLMDLA